ncbi:hypothetical protein Glove_33g166 [Diversispora epigaea]|uniref:Uncharacterized protein n=1 Tax=Diversispora epigaea TaxID=1348612 RepID=A0A397JRM9_9GLOM|nr:hypothetical protein Glove_33g166 [Diversispora epigaea]
MATFTIALTSKVFVLVLLLLHLVQKAVDCVVADCAVLLTVGLLMAHPHPDPIVKTILLLLFKDDNVLGLITFALGLILTFILILGITEFRTNIKIHLVTFDLHKEVVAVGVEDIDGAAVIDDEYCIVGVGSAGGILLLHQSFALI